MNRQKTMALEGEADLIARAKDGDEGAFGKLFHHHHSLIHNLCLGMTGNVLDAEDRVQDVFLAAFRKLGTFRGKSAFSTWLYRVAVNVVLMSLRGSRRKARHVSMDEERENQSTGNYPKRDFPIVDLRLKGSVDRVDLDRAISRLPKGQREVFVFHDVSGYEHHEVAKLLGCSTGNSKSQLHKARLRLKEFLAPTQKKISLRTAQV